MALQFSNAVRNAEAAAIQTTIQTAGTTTMAISLYNGTEPASCGTALSGNTLLATGTLPNPFLTNSAGTSQIVGTYTLVGQSGAGAGTPATFFRILDAAATCHIQGSAGASGTDMILNNTSIANGQTVTVSAFTIVQGNS